MRDGERKDFIDQAGFLLVHGWKERSSNRHNCLFEQVGGRVRMHSDHQCNKLPQNPRAARPDIQYFQFSFVQNSSFRKKTTLKCFKSSPNWAELIKYTSDERISYGKTFAIGLYSWTQNDQRSDKETKRRVQHGFSHQLRDNFQTHNQCRGSKATSNNQT